MSLAPGKQNYPMDLFPMENSPGSEHHSEVNKIQRMIYDQLFPTPNPPPQPHSYSRQWNDPGKVGFFLGSCRSGYSILFT